MTGPLAAAVLRELVQELLEEEEAFHGAKRAGVTVVEQDDGRLRCEVHLEVEDLSVTAGVYAPRAASRRRLRIEMLKAIGRGLDRAQGKEGSW